jgi:lipid-A-disaccharide synthase
MHITVAIVAGEASGDLIGSSLVRNLKKKYPYARFIGVGGPLMISAGLEPYMDYERLSLHGLGWDVLKKIPGLLLARRKLAKKIINAKPTLFIGIDAPDFNLSLEAKLKKNGIETIHYVSPSVWAWRKGRVKKIVKSVSRILTLFPFEYDCYKNTPIKVDYVGHPLADVFPLRPNTAVARRTLNLNHDDIVFALLPGSRVNEVKYLSEVMINTAIKLTNVYPEAVFLVPMVNRKTKEIFEQNLYRITYDMFHPPNIKVLFGHSKLAMEASDIVLVASGTASLEVALLKKPMVITYKVPSFSWFILKRLRYLPFVGLPNILCGQFVVPELLQENATSENLSHALIEIMNDKKRRSEIAKKFSNIHHSLRQNTQKRILSIISEYIDGK